MMQLKDLTKKLLIFCGVAALMIGALMAALPLLLDRQAVRLEATARLSQWAGTTIEINGDIDISYYPVVTVRASDVKLGRLWPLRRVAGVSARQLQAELNWWPLLFGKIEIGALILQEPVVTVIEPKSAALELKDTDSKAPDMDGTDGRAPVKNVNSLPPIARFLHRASVEQVVVHDGRIIFEPNGDLAAAIEAKFTLPNGLVTASGMGSFRWGGKTVHFDGTMDPVNLAADTATTFMKLKLSAQEMSAEFDGEVSAFDQFQLNGKLDLAADDLRELASWLGYALPKDGPGLKGFQANGVFSWVGGRLAFDQAKYTLDGNVATGAMSLDRDQSPPLFEGTLAFPSLRLTDYISRPDIKEDETAVQAPIMRAYHLDLFKHFDADLRISTGEIVAGNLQTGHSAMTLALRRGVLKADFAELSIFDGTGVLSLQTDLRSPSVLVDATASLQGISADKILPVFGINPIIDGKAGVSVSLSARGATMAQMSRSVDGLVKIDMAHGGEIAIGLKDLIKQAGDPAQAGWGRAIRQKTTFNKMVADFRVRNGLMHTRDFKVVTDVEMVTGDGTLDVNEKSLDWELIIKPADGARRTTNGRVRNKTLGETRKDFILSVKGPWSNPTIRGVEKKAALPSYFRKIDSQILAGRKTN